MSNYNINRGSQFLEKINTFETKIKDNRKNNITNQVNRRRNNNNNQNLSEKKVEKGEKRNDSPCAQNNTINQPTKEKKLTNRESSTKKIYENYKTELRSIFGEKKGDKIYEKYKNSFNELTLNDIVNSEFNAIDYYDTSSQANPRRNNKNIEEVGSEAKKGLEELSGIAFEDYTLLRNSEESKLFPLLNNPEAEELTLETLEFLKISEEESSLSEDSSWGSQSETQAEKNNQQVNNFEKHNSTEKNNIQNNNKQIEIKEIKAIPHLQKLFSSEEVFNEKSNEYAKHLKENYKKINNLHLDIAVSGRFNKELAEILDNEIKAFFKIFELKTFEDIKKSGTNQEEVARNINMLHAELNQNAAFRQLIILENKIFQLNSNTIFKKLNGKMHLESPGTEEEIKKMIILSDITSLSKEADQFIDFLKLHRDENKLLEVKEIIKTKEGLRQLLNAPGTINLLKNFGLLEKK